MRELRGKLAVVTGAASGIGRALAIALAEQGSDLALADVQLQGLEETAAGVQALGRKASTHALDVAEREQMQAFPRAVLDAHGRVDVLVNNAGITAGYAFRDQPIEDFERVIRVNFMGAVYGCKFFLPHLLERPEAHVVNLSSMFGFLGIPTQSAYCASKFAVRGLSESLWAELRGSSVGLTCVHPGGVRTNIVRASTGWSAGRDEAAEAFDRIARTPPERAAARIVRAILRGKRRLRIGPDAYVADWIARVFPKISSLFPPPVQA